MRSVDFWRVQSCKKVLWSGDFAKELVIEVSGMTGASGEASI